ncbi:SGNH/GDSL hydrolase family protein [Prosthecobacter sp.]|jgi:lysophospholipase L1-like esterase|uniref:SGNH/GDSL hydrolase family protein n=1 Tax=Prosthecobacter sp. TaxID=1965333 RepID=UPI0037849D53
MKHVFLLLVLTTLNAASDRVVPREGTEWCNIWMPNANKHGLPRVLLIGDSVTQGYGPDVEKALAGKAYVARLATSRCVGDPVLHAELSAVLGAESFDVIHFNNSLHGIGAVSEKEYAEFLPQMLAHIRQLAPKAKLIWATCTPSHVNGKFEQLAPNNANVTERNRIATELMKKECIPVDDLYALTLPHPEWCSDGLHYKPEGKAAQGAQVAAEVAKLLPKAK